MSNAIFSISIGDVLQNSGIIHYNKPEYFIYSKETYFLNSCITEKFVRNILKTDFSDFLDSVFSGYFENSDTLDDKVLKVNDALLNSAKRTSALNKITEYFNDNIEYLMFPLSEPDYLFYKVYFRCGSKWYFRFFNSEEFQYTEEKIRNCTTLKLFKDDKYLLLDILKNALNSLSTLNDEENSDKLRIQRIMQSLL